MPAHPGVILLLATVALWSGTEEAGAEEAGALPAKHHVSINGFSIGLDSAGNIASMVIGKDARPWPVSGSTSLDRLHASGEASIASASGSQAFSRTFVDAEGHSALVTDRFTPDQDAIRWDVTIQGGNAPWSTAIISMLKTADVRRTLIWTAWGSPDSSGTQMSAKLTAQIQAGKASVGGAWSDPLVPAAFLDRTWHYGNVAQNLPVGDDFVALPLMTLLSPATDTGLSLVLSPDDVMLNMTLRVSASGQISYSRTNHRLGGGRPVSFTMHLVPHEASWRGGLRFMTRRYPSYFDPPNPRAEAIAGCGAYSGDENQIDVAKFKKMAFGFNWKLSDDFAYMGMFIPPVKTADEQWTRSGDERRPPGKGDSTSCRQLNDYARYMKSNGFAVLNYFNATEFGKKMYGKQGPRQMIAGPNDADLWKDPVAYLKYRLPHAVFDAGIRTCYSAHVMDPGDGDYCAFILEQAERHIRMIPDSDGICIDRADHLRRYNLKADDGVSLVDGKPARSLFRSWLNLMSQLGPLMHKADKVIFCNLMTVRLELGRELDGIYTEFGTNGGAFNASALLGTRKPVIGWTKNETLQQPDPDSFMQRHLYLGVFPTAPYPTNNHCIQPTPEADRLYCDYGPLLTVLRGRKWVLEPECISCRDAKTNLFQIPGGYAASVTFGGKAESVLVHIRIQPGMDTMRYAVLHPGSEKPQSLTVRVVDGTMEALVPLVRGCAMMVMTR